MKMMGKVENRTMLMLDLVLMWFIVINDLVEQDSGGR